MEKTTYATPKEAVKATIEQELEAVAYSLQGIRDEARKGAEGGYFSHAYIAEKTHLIRGSMKRIEKWSKGVADDS